MLIDALLDAWNPSQPASHPIPMPADPLRQHLLTLLAGKGAHADFDAAVEGLPAELRGIRPADLPHSPWELLEHLRIAQWDILQFIRDPRHQSPDFPSGYWPRTPDPPDDAAWEQSIDSFHADHQAITALLADPATDLFAKLPHGDGQTVLRELLLVADHNAYHIGELVLTRRLLHAWH